MNELCFCKIYFNGSLDLEFKSIGLCCLVDWISAIWILWLRSNFLFKLWKCEKGWRWIEGSGWFCWFLKMMFWNRGGDIITSIWWLQLTCFRMQKERVWLLRNLWAPDFFWENSSSMKFFSKPPFLSRWSLCLGPENTKKFHATVSIFSILGPGIGKASLNPVQIYKNRKSDGSKLQILQVGLWAGKSPEPKIKPTVMVILDHCWVGQRTQQWYLFLAYSSPGWVAFPLIFPTE